MKCVRCAAEIPSHSQFCMRCGTPIAASRGGAVTMARPVAAAAGPNKKLIAAIAGGILLLAALLFGGYRLLTNRSARTPEGGKVLEAKGLAAPGGPLLDRNARISEGGPLTNRSGLQTPPAPQPVDVIDYLKFLKEIERQRVALEKQQVASALKASTDLTGGNLTAEMGDNPEVQHRKDYANFQQLLNQMASQWQGLSQQFLTKQPPQSCQQLANRYYDLLGKTSAAMASVGNSFSKAMSGDASGALQSLSSERGSGIGTPSKDVADACTAADDELAKVCDKFKIHKDFAIQDDGGGGNLLGGL